jgi:hypothetical protein
MKFSSNLEQRDFFNKNGFVSFEGLLNPQEMDLLNQVIDNLSPQEREKFQTRDLFLRNDAVKKIVLSSKLVRLAYEFLQKKPLRIAFDQILLEKGAKANHSGKETFQEMCCLGGLEGIFLICIQSPMRIDDSAPHELTAGNGFLISPSVPYPFFSMAPAPGHRFIMIGYGGVYSQYLYEPRDPHCHYLKSLGYVFGDRLNDRDHPILLR